MIRLLTLVLIVTLGYPAYGQVSQVKTPDEVKVELKSPSTIPNISTLVWNRWEEKNFVVCSLDNNQGKYLYDHVEQVKKWAINRWEVKDFPFETQCKIISVNDQKLFQMFFQLDRTKVEIRRDAQGKIEEAVIFLLVDESKPPSATVPIPLTEVCFAFVAEKYGTNYQPWFNGIAELNGNLNQITNNILLLKSRIVANEPIYFGYGVLGINDDEYRNLTAEEKKLHRASAMVYCLLIQKTYGAETITRMMKECSPVTADGLLYDITGKSIDQFDVVFKKYLIDLIDKIDNKQIKNKDLQILR